MPAPIPVPPLEEQLRGDIVRPDHPDYEVARHVYNGMIDKRPALIARCRDVADVIDAVAYARARGLPPAIRGGGHSAPGLGVCDDGLVVDLSPMRSVRVDPDARTARVDPGCVWGDVDHATHAFGLAAVSGIISTTGVGGLTLGGGHGYLTRKYGLTIDNLLGADVVLADGRLVHASEDEHPDLFWAIRGGGGNFGVVTSFLFRLHPVDVVHAGPTFWSIDDAEAALKWYRDFLPAAPEDVYGFFEFLAVPPEAPFPAELHGRTVCGVTWCYCGPEEGVDEALAPLADAPRPIFHHVGPMPFPTLQSMHDAFYPPGLQWYWKGDFIRELTDEAVDAHLAFGPNLPTPLSTMHLYPIDGAVHRVPSDATAFSHRDATWSQVIVGVQPEGDAQRMTQWARDYWQAVHPYSAGASYVNFMMEEGGDRIRATYGDNYERLVDVKTKYDPQNLFCVNQNIEPRG